ncbi:hypothetical protein B0T17DRAFT_500892 [Bombardia bombarda]|uniref:Rhodopsin domain-containing protein n=1 Tax=Bombardia bombarda TaxID=252184 RepID=A0AA39WAG3_9PEZI|nr:hypothetical protein B0T17DRAFT_500892 [Bombardia bombarda]
MPALDPPAGEVPDFDSPPNRNDIGIIVSVVCVTLTTLMVLARGYFRIVAMKKVAIQDFLALSSFGCYIGYIYCVLSLVHSPGVFVHQWNIRLRDLTEVLWIIHLGANFYGIVIGCMKTAILLDWLQMFTPGNARKTNTKFFYACWAVISVNALYYFSATITQNLSCIPFEKIWDKTIPGGHCIDEKVLQIVAAAINLVSDVAILILPQHIIWKLQISQQKKIGVSLIFAVGIFGCIAAGIRLSYSISFHSSPDASYAVSLLALWSVGEMSAVFLVFCVPAIPKTLKHLGLWKLLFPNSPNSSAAKSGGSNVLGGGLSLSGKSGGGSGAHHHRNSMPLRYQKLDRERDGVPLKDLPSNDSQAVMYSSESTERLQDDAVEYQMDPKNDFGILRTTQVVTVTTPAVHVQPRGAPREISRDRLVQDDRQHPWVAR